MFLGVSARVGDMEEMTAEERARLGGMVRQVRMERYPTKLAAYQDVGINSATWDRIEKGETVKDHTLRLVIKHLWPSAAGDWQQVPGVRFGDLDYSVLGDTSSEDYPLQVERWILELQERVELLEKHVYKQPKESPDAQHTAPNKQAGGSPAMTRDPDAEKQEAAERLLDELMSQDDYRLAAHEPGYDIEQEQEETEREP